MAASTVTHITAVDNLIERWSARSMERVEGPGRSFDYWVSARATAVPGGSVTILVGADREPVESVVTKVAPCSRSVHRSSSR